MSDNLTHHFALSLFHSYEDGTTAHETVDVYLDPKTLSFYINVPAYIANSPIDGATELITGLAFGDVSGQYEKLSELYSRWKLTAQATPMLLIDLVSIDEDRPASCMVSFAVRECMVTADGRHISIQGNPWIEVTVLTGTLIPDEPDLRDRMLNMIVSFNTAAGIAREITMAEDPVAYIRALDVPWATPPKSETITPADDAPKTVMTDDEEL